MKKILLVGFLLIVLASNIIYANTSSPRPAGRETPHIEERVGNMRSNVEKKRELQKETSLIRSNRAKTLDLKKEILHQKDLIQAKVSQNTGKETLNNLPSLKENLQTIRQLYRELKRTFGELRKLSLTLRSALLKEELEECRGLMNDIIKLQEERINILSSIARKLESLYNSL